MPCKPVVFTVILLVLSAHLSFADTFIVTSNADSGPGTFRDAIEKANANGTAATDYIHFNIAAPTYNLRIIDLVTELPALSSNLIIDGTTQPGTAYGTTDARICLRKTTYSPSFSMLKIENAQHVQVYGLHLFYGYWQGFFGSPYRSTQLYGVNIISADDIVIGGAGKGNVISGVVHAIYSNSDGCSNITIRSNYLGHGAFYASPADDIDNVVLNSESCITLGNVKDIFIGGPQPADGNIFGSNRRGINIDSKNAIGNGLISIQNNIFARKYDKVTFIPTSDFWDKYISIARSRNNPVSWVLSNTTDYRVELLDNDISCVANIVGITDSLIVLRNKFFEGRTSLEGKLNISRVGKGIIGGDDPANANYFLYKKMFGSGETPPALALYETGPVTVLKNIFTCNSVYGSTIYIYNTLGKIPFAQVDNTTSTSVSGRATPNSRIDLYYDDECTACEGKVYLATVQSDAAGAWTYSGTITGTVIATATKDGWTSMFSYPTFDEKNRKVVQPTCGLKNGSVTGITTEGAETYFWYNYTTSDTVSKTKDLLNAGPGQYRQYAVHGGTCIIGNPSIIILEDVTPQINMYPMVKQPACGLSNGNITGMRVYNIQNSKLEWKNESGQVVSNQIEVYNLPAGKYTFYVTDLTAGCTAVSPTYELINQNGPSLNTGAVQILPTTCGNANGSITGITASNVTGAPYTQWVNALNQPVSTGYDLLHVPAGTYRFKFKDQSSCDTIIRSFTINAQTTFSPITVTSFTAKDGLCDQPAASINIQSFNVNPANYTFRWVNAGSGASVGYGTAISSLPAGTYQLFATDNNNCESKIFTATVKVVPKPSFDYSSVTISNDQCNLQEGAIANLKINGLISPTTYTWFDQNGNQVGGNTGSLQKMPAGTYYLQVTDGGTCTVQSRPFTIRNTDGTLPAPAYTDLIISRHSDATLTVKNHSTGDYKLFTDASGSALSQQNETGNFTIPAVPADMTFYIQQSKGSCYSPLVPVSIKVVDKSYFTIPNAFTPNNDGKNDRLPVRVKGYIEVNYFKIYNRWGQIIFETKKLNDGWDGTWKGVLQQTGTYVWVAEGKDLLGITIRDKGSFVLIR